MTNGIHTEEEWKQAEAPLITLDDLLTEFAKEKQLNLIRNSREDPDRILADYRPKDLEIGNYKEGRVYRHVEIHPLFPINGVVVYGAAWYNTGSTRKWLPAYKNEITDFEGNTNQVMAAVRAAYDITFNLKKKDLTQESPLSFEVSGKKA